MRMVYRIFNMKIFKNLADSVTSFGEWLVIERINVVQWLIGVTILVFIKTVLVAFSSQAVGLLSGDIFGFIFLREWSFYMALLLGELLLLFVLTKEKVFRIGGFLLAAMACTFIPYIFSIFFPLGSQSAFLGSSLVINSLQGAVAQFTDFFAMVPVDFRLEIYFSIVLLAVFIFMKTRDGVRALAGAILFTIGWFVLYQLPYIAAWLVHATVFLTQGTISYLSPSFSGIDAISTLFYVPLSSVFAIIIYFFYNRLKFFAGIHNVIRFPRLAVNLGVLTLGFLFALSERPIIQFTLLDVLFILSAYVSVMFYWAWAVQSNDLDDQNGDAVAMKLRPLQQGIVLHEEVRNLNIIFLIISLVSAFIVGYGFLLFILIRICIGYMYSSDPFRFKRFPILSNATMAAAYLSTMLAGYMIVADHTILTFSSRLAGLFFLFYILSSEFKNLTTYEGDKVDEIITIPVWFGLEQGKKIVGAMGFLAFLLVPLFFTASFAVLILPALVAGGWYYWTITRTNYEDNEIYLVHLAFAAYLIVLYMLHLIKV
jgi:4-hydroxybenzoate polyprenyltransferase